MKVTYRDDIGILEVVVDGYNVDFMNGFVFFSSGEKDYKIAIENIICVSKVEDQAGKKVVTNEKYGSCRCPRCNKVVGISEHYCSQCGQKLDWRK